MSIEYGLTSFKFMAVGGSTLESLGKILEGTPKFFGDKASLAQFFAAQNPDYPALTLKEKAGIRKITFTLMEFDADILVRLFGGVSTGTTPNKTYAAARVDANIHGSFELVTESALKITGPKAYLDANFNWTFDRKSVSSIECELTIELPDVVTDMPYTIARVV